MGYIGYLVHENNSNILNLIHCLMAFGGANNAHQLNAYAVLGSIIAVKLRELQSG
jgi:hypothetical protein